MSNALLKPHFCVSPLLVFQLAFQSRKVGGFSVKPVSYLMKPVLYVLSNSFFKNPVLTSLQITS